MLSEAQGEEWITYSEFKRRVNAMISPDTPGCSLDSGNELLQSVEDQLFQSGKTIVACAVCAQKVGLRRCGECPRSKERYCSCECQKAAWSAHKRVCGLETQE